MSLAITNRHDIMIMFDITNGNPNGDPDSGNMPRVDPASSLGLVSDVCLKRKVRNFVNLFAPTVDGKQFGIFIQQGEALETLQKRAEKATEEKGKTNRKHAEDAKNWLCRAYYDIRTFGAVVSTGQGPLSGSPFGQIRGPAQFTFGRSFHPITPLEITITRCAVTQEKKADEGVERTMGQKYIVPYGLYAARCYISPAFAENTKFDQADFDLLIEALSHLFDHDRSAARGDMVVRGLFDFEHIGTQTEANAEQNRREARLGCAHAHELFETIQVDLKDKNRPPQAFIDYSVKVEEKWNEHGRSEDFPGVVLHRRVDPERKHRS